MAPAVLAAAKRLTAACAGDAARRYRRITPARNPPPTALLERPSSTLAFFVKGEEEVLETVWTAGIRTPIVIYRRI
jgi:hypothetical protein